MGSEIAVRKGVLVEILTRASASTDEICGLLLGEPGEVAEVVHCFNVAANPAMAFEIDPARLIAAHKAARAGRPSIVGCYHSHPGGAAAPSPRDAADAAPNGWLWLIVAQGEVAMYRAVAGGDLHGRFQPVAWRAGLHR